MENKKLSDAELIQEAEKLHYNQQATTYQAVSRNFGRDLAVSTLLLLPELARRLKAANERIVELAPYRGILKFENGSTIKASDERLSCCGLLCNELEGDTWECARCGKVYD